LELSGSEGEEGEMGEATQLGLMVITCIMMATYIIMGSVCEERKCSFGHETGFILILGLVFSACIFYFSGKTTHWELDARTLFQICIPLILFAEGYNMHRSRFRREISNSMALGILAVIVTFFLHTLLTKCWIELFGIDITTHTFDDEGSVQYSAFGTSEDSSNDVDFFSAPQIMLLAAIFSSIDLLAVMPQIPENLYPKIATIVSG
jgi:hypothetical protein